MLIKLNKNKKETPFEKFCILSQYYSHMLSKDFFISVKEGLFTLNFDKATFTDITLCVEGLKILPCIRSLILNGKFLTPTNIPKSVLRKSFNKTVEIPPAPHSLYHLGKLIEGLTVNFTAKGSLLTLHLSGFHLDCKGWRMLNNCLRAVNTLKELSITFCDLKDEDLTIFSAAFDLKDLVKLNLSHNLLQNDGCDIISRVISKVNSSQTELNWSCNLRRGLTRPVPSGLREVNLSHNRIPDKGLINLSHGLFYDEFVKILDLSHNTLTPNAYQELSNLLKTNSSLILINLNQNSKTTNTHLIAEISEKLHLNFQSNQWVIDEEVWAGQMEDLQNMLVLGVKENRASSAKKRKMKRVGLGSEHKGLHEKDMKSTMRSCDKCEEFERELFKSKSQCVDLQIKNNLLQKKLKTVKGER